MGEIGQVISVKGKLAEVSLHRPDACGHCNACSIGVESKATVLEVENICGAEIGETVEISLEESNFLLAVLIMYIIPLISLLIGIGLGYFIGDKIGIDQELTALVLGFALLAITYVLIRKNEERFHVKRFRPLAIKIVDDYQSLDTCSTNNNK